MSAKPHVNVGTIGGRTPMASLLFAQALLAPMTTRIPNSFPLPDSTKPRPISKYDHERIAAAEAKRLRKSQRLPH